MDRPANPMVVNSVIWFDEPLDWPAQGVIPSAGGSVPALPPARRRAARPAAALGGRLRVRRRAAPPPLALPAPGDRAALQELVSDLIAPPLDPTRPLWHVYLIDGYGKGCASCSGSTTASPTGSPSRG